MSELSPRDVDGHFDALVSGLRVGGAEPVGQAGEGHPATLVRRLTPEDGDLSGTRARFLMTTFDKADNLIAYGWRTDLRILSHGLSKISGLQQLGVQVVDECGYYTGDHTRQVIVDYSRIWVEELVRVRRSSAAAEPSGAWLRGALDDPNEPVIEPLHPVAGRHHVLGARLIRDLGDGRYQQNLRAVASARVTTDGDLVVAVVHERQWYEWHKHDYTSEHRPVGHLRVLELWVE